MKAIIFSLSALLLVSSFGCASSGSNEDRRMAIVTREVARIAPPSTKLSGFANYEIKPMTFGAEIQNDAGKLDYGETLEGMLTSKLSPMLDDWSNAAEGGSGTLVIEPRLRDLCIVSGGARFWVAPGLVPPTSSRLSNSLTRKTTKSSPCRASIKSPTPWREGGPRARPTATCSTTSSTSATTTSSNTNSRLLLETN